jgi:hypothetical protein
MHLLTSLPLLIISADPRNYQGNLARMRQQQVDG